MQCFKKFLFPSASGGVVLLVCAGLIQGCTSTNPDVMTSGTEQSPDSELDGKRIYFTTEPGRKQKTLDKGMNAFAQYLTKEVGLPVGYKPAISYQHAYELFRTGQVDMIRVGIYGGYKVLEKNVGAQTLAIQKPSYISVLIGNKKLRAKSESANDSTSKDLRVIEAERVGFGSLYSGSTFMWPLLDMRSQGVSLAQTSECVHVSNQLDLPVMVAVGHLDYAFIKGNTTSLLSRVSKEYLPSIYVAWKSPEVKRNNYFIVSRELVERDGAEVVQLLRHAIINLSPKDEYQEKVLNGLSKGAQGFELPNADFPGPVNERISQLMTDYGKPPSCETE